LGLLKKLGVFNPHNTASNFEDTDLERSMYRSRFQRSGPCDWWTQDTDKLLTSLAAAGRSLVKTPATAEPLAVAMMQRHHGLVHSCLTRSVIPHTESLMMRSELMHQRLSTATLIK